MPLLNKGNSKTVKGEKYGFRTFGLHLSPANKSGFNVCHWSSAGCRVSCLDTAGRGCMSNVQKARIAKTKRFFTDKLGFMQDLHKEIESSIRNALRKELIPCFRLNLTSDLPWENIKHNGISIIDKFPDRTFYDYTKGFTRMLSYLNGKLPSNYHLTFSKSEVTTDQQVDRVINSGGNVAVVFRDRLPKTYRGIEVVNGDDSDLRFKDGKGVIVGLIEKGLATKDETGFVVEP